MILIHNLIRKLFYIYNVAYIKVIKRKATVFFSSEIKQPKLLGEYCKIGKRTYLNGKLGNYSYIGENCRINANIGKFCSISNDVRTVDGSHPYHFVSTSPVFYSSSKQCGKSFVDENYFEDIVFMDEDTKTTCEIGNDVWIGENVLIKSGVIIGTGACVAMGSVVTKNVEPYTIVAGVPARVIKKRFPDETIKSILNSEWWNKPEDYLIQHAGLFRDVNLFVERISKE